MSINRKACFIVPFKRTNKDDECVKYFLESAHKYNMSKYLIFVIDDNDAYKYLSSIDNDIKLIVAHPKALVNNNIVTMKKFYGIEHVYKDYDYIAAIDCDSLFLKTFDPYELFNEIWESKSCFYKTTALIKFRQMDFFMTAAACGLENNLILKKETNNFTDNIWFNDIPVYKSSDMKDFFIWLKTTKTSNGKTVFQNVENNICCFDYFVYWYWLICYKGLTSERSERPSYELSLLEETFDIYNNYMSFVEGRVRSGQEVNKYHKFAEMSVLQDALNIEKIINTHWTARDYEKTKDIIPNDNLYIQIHIDRIQNISNWRFYYW